MSNKFVSHYNGKIVRTDLYDGLVVHKQESLPTTIYLPDQPGQFVLYTDGSGNYSFETFEQQEQESVQLIPSQFMNDDNTCCFSKGYPSVLVANSANDWTELKLNTGYFQVIRYTDGVFDTVTANGTVIASIIGMNRTNTTTNTLLYVDGSTKTDNKVAGISMSTSGYYMLYNNLTNSRVDAMYVNPLNMFNRALGLNSNTQGLLAYQGNSLSKINTPTNSGYYIWYNNNGTHSFVKPTMVNLLSAEDTANNYKEYNTGIPYLNQGSARSMLAPTVTQNTNCLITVNADKSMVLTPLTNTEVGQVSFETYERYTNVKDVSHGTVVDVSELFPMFTMKQTGTHKIEIHVVMFIEDTSVFDTVKSNDLACIEFTSGDNTDTMYLMNPMSNIVNIRLSVPLAVSNSPTLTFNLGKNTTGCKILASLGRLIVTKYSNI